MTVCCGIGAYTDRTRRLQLNVRWLPKPQPVPRRCRYVCTCFLALELAAFRCAWRRIITDLGSEFRHHVIALDGVADAQTAIGPGICCSVEAFPPQNSNLLSRLLIIRSTLGRLRANLLVTYNWGAIEWALANRLFVGLPHIHHEAGFGKEEAKQQLRRRIQLRRVALHGAQRIVVPSRTLERIALNVWKLPRHRVIYLPNGIDDTRFAKARTFARSGESKRPCHYWQLGALAPREKYRPASKSIRDRP